MTYPRPHSVPLAELTQNSLTPYLTFFSQSCAVIRSSVLPKASKIGVLYPFRSWEVGCFASIYTVKPLPDFFFFP